MIRRAALLLLAIASSAFAAATAQFSYGRVYSALDPGTTSAIAVWMEALAAKYEAVGYPRRNRDAPVRVIILENALELAPYLGQDAQLLRNPGLSIAGIDHQDILVGWGPTGDPWRTLAHELAHLVDPFTNRPVWFREGFAEYLSRLDAPPHAPDAALTRGAWIPLADVLAARRRDFTTRLPGFYSECRLLVEWMVAAGTPVDRLSPAKLDELIAERGLEEVEREVRNLAELYADSPPLPLIEPPTPTAPAREAEPFEQAVVLADVLRSLGRIEAAESALRALDVQYPDAPAVQAALGALAFDRRRYREAERRLRIAVRSPSTEPRTFHRLALLLLRPVDDAGPDREAEAVLYAKMAAEARPADPMFRLTLAQALMAAGEWEPSACELARLRETPGWAKQAFDEYRELQRRRMQAMWEVPPPALAPTATWSPPAGLFARIPAKPIPVPPKGRRSRPITRWPPPGTVMVAGKIQTVECSGGEKVIVLASRLFSMRFREPKGRPARLFSPPLAWDELPCGTYGWYVNMAYRPLRGQDFRGEVVAILF